MVNEILSELNNKFDNQFRASSGIPDDCNTITTEGFYKRIIEPSTPNSPDFYCYLLVISYVGVTITQVAIGYNVNKIAIRCRFNNVWNSWTEL